MNELRVCVDLDLSKQQRRQALRSAVRESELNRPAVSSAKHHELLARFLDGGEEAIADHHLPVIDYLAMLPGKMWARGRTLKIGFIDGSSTQRSKVQAHAVGWLSYANINFDFAHDEPDIRISFQYDPGSWSAIGTDALATDPATPTINFGWLTDETDDQEYHRVVLHEFGHMLGCIHEHQNPAGGIHWNKPVVYKYYQGPPNNWKPADVDANIFQTYDRDITQFTDLDPKSIMLYPIPPGFTTNGFVVGINGELSSTDKAFISEQYPGRTVVPGLITDPVPPDQSGGSSGAQAPAGNGVAAPSQLDSKTTTGPSPFDPDLWRVIIGGAVIIAAFVMMGWVIVYGMQAIVASRPPGTKTPPLDVTSITSILSAVTGTIGVIIGAFFGVNVTAGARQQAEQRADALSNQLVAVSRVNAQQTARAMDVLRDIRN